MNRLLILLMALTLTACGKKESQSTESADLPAQSITQAVHEPLERAKGVEQILEGAEQQRREQVDGL